MIRPVTAATALIAAVAMPLAAMADKPAHARKGNGHGKAAKMERKSDPRDHRRQARTGRDPVVVVPGEPVRRAQMRACPPGLAKKDPACIPPGQAKKMGYSVGERIDWSDAHLVRRPGLYGLGEAPVGQRYAIVDGRIVRVDRETSRILSVIRVIDAILD